MCTPPSLSLAHPTRPLFLSIMTAACDHLPAGISPFRSLPDPRFKQATHRVRAGRRAHVLPGASASAPRLSRVATSGGGGYRWSSANCPRPTTGKGERCPCWERRCCGEGAHEWWERRELLGRKPPESRDKHGLSGIRSNNSSCCRGKRRRRRSGRGGVLQEQWQAVER